MKRNIKPIEDLSKFDAVRFNQFNFKGRDVLRYGVVAQNLNRIAPELVHTNSDGYLTVSYTDLLVAKTARQDEQIKDLTKRVEWLEKQLTKLLEDEN